MRTAYRLSLAAAAGALATAGLAGPPLAHAAAHAVVSAAAPTARHAPVPRQAGRATATPHSVSLRHLARVLRPKKTATAGHVIAPRFDLITPTGADITSEFDGITQASASGGALNVRPDPSSATNGSQIVEIAGGFLQVTDNNGAVLCGGGITVNHLLGTSDVLAQPKVIYDNFQGHFIVAASLVSSPPGARPVVWVATSNSSNPCQTWNLYRLTFSGRPYTPGTVFDSTVLGQDRRAVLVEAKIGGPLSYSVFAITKSDLYAGKAVSFPAFIVSSQAAPVSNAGEPMIDSPVSYFLGADPQIGYQLYRMTGSGTPNPHLTLVATIGRHYAAPLQAQVPGGTGPDTGDGRIETSPVFDGSRIWFAHGVAQLFHPASVRLGYINLADNTEADSLMTVDPLFSYEFNGSVGVGLNADGTEAVFANWAYTDPSKNLQVSDAVDSFVFNGGGQGTFGDEQTLLTGTAISTFQFGSYSSVAVEPNKFGVTTCAITTQEYFDGTWNTRLARVCSPTTINVPFVTGDTVAQAASVFANYDLSVGPQSSTTNCDPAASGTIAFTTPAVDHPIQLGSPVGVTLCTATPATVTVPNVLSFDNTSAQNAIIAAGLTVGSVHLENSCVADAGTVLTQDPSGGTQAPPGSAVDLTETSGVDPRGNPCIIF